jgi:hypothetical protein
MSQAQSGGASDDTMHPQPAPDVAEVAAGSAAVLGSLISAHNARAMESETAYVVVMADER